MDKKSPDAFRTISEVAEWLGVPTHVLRFWESRFSQIKPVKRAGGRRYYRPKDMALLGGIRKILHEDGMTIRGAQKLLRKKGVKHVAAMSPPIENNEVIEEASSNIVTLSDNSKTASDQLEVDLLDGKPEGDTGNIFAELGTTDTQGKSRSSNATSGEAADTGFAEANEDDVRDEADTSNTAQSVEDEYISELPSFIRSRADAHSGETDKSDDQASAPLACSRRSH